MAEDKAPFEKEPGEQAGEAAAGEAEPQVASEERESVEESLEAETDPESISHGFSGAEEQGPPESDTETLFVQETEIELAGEYADEDTEDGVAKPGAKKRLGAWFGKQTKKVVSQLYESRVDDIEHRARRAVSSAYEDQADDLEERAVRAMRSALTEESDRIKEVIEHAIQIKKREVRLSLLVLVVASLLYLILYWITR